MMCCASCGTVEVDDIKLKKCTTCKSHKRYKTFHHCSANMGHNKSVDSLKKGLKAGIVGKEDLASTTLRAHLAAVGAMKSYHRDE
ncbi:hypothetical protein QTG54_002609 [Skeletonema marinoi]|uniref:Uncharacterized protein n=1 Tax=Skeletonema marinoi TaxID=267567 RepID=A0AAD8YKZ0_9STRA|nr:hypothetical protein QTG54_002609 [Skeletonema marinoi]